MEQMQSTATTSSANVKSPAAPSPNTANTYVQTLAKEQRARNIPVYRYEYI